MEKKLLDELDLVPQKFKDGSLSKTECAVKAMEIVYLNPGRFRLHDMDEDERSDFLLWSIPTLEKMIERHDEKRSPFGAYVYHSLRCLRMTWERIKEEDTDDYYMMKRNLRDTYTNGEARRFYVASPASDDSEEEEENEQDEEQKKDIYSRTQIPHRLIFKKVASGKRGFAVLRKNDIELKRSAIILALKSAWYIDENSIEKVSEFSRCEKEWLSEEIESIRKKLVDKSELREKIIKKRDRAWYFICKYRKQLLDEEKGSAGYFEKKKKLEYQTRLWKTKNLMLQKTNYKSVVADNDEIANVLELTPKMVKKYIKFAVDFLKKKEESEG